MDVFLEEKIDEIVEKIKEEYNITTGGADYERSKAGDLFLPGQRWSYCSGPPLNGEQERIFLTEFIKKLKGEPLRNDYKEFMKGVLTMVDNDTRNKKLFFLKGNTQNPLLAKIHSELVEEAEEWSAEQLSDKNFEIELPTTVVRRPLEISTTVVRPVVRRPRTTQPEVLRRFVRRRIDDLMDNLQRWLIKFKPS